MFMSVRVQNDPFLMWNETLNFESFVADAFFWGRTKDVIDAEGFKIPNEHNR